SGIGTAAHLRTLMRRETGITPSAYRSRFGPGREWCAAAGATRRRRRPARASPPEPRGGPGPS
ncbi:AraC family transcriptional regulator, partial [Streptomyces albidoflavus]